MLNSNTLSHWKSEHPYLWGAVQVLAFGSIFLVGFLATLAVILISRMPAGQVLAQKLSWLFATNNQQIMWYITRAAGWVAYLLLWFSNVWGLAIPSKLFNRFLSPTFTVDFHEYISLLSIGFVILHVIVLLFDRYLPYTLAEILIPFLSPYRPLWVGMGVLTFYLTLLVTITFYLRGRIGMKAFRSIHLLSFVAYIGAVLHSFFSGTDSSLGAAQILYFSTFLVIVFLTAYWVLIGRKTKQSHPQPVNAQPVRAYQIPQR